MESSSGEIDKNREELTGRKKSRFKQLKTRLFGKLKKKESEGLIKQSQSASDIMAPEGRREGYDSEDEFTFPHGLSSRALSHDSIFITDQTLSTEPTRVLSQENVHGKIKALQLKLQQQNLHLGPPPMLIPGKRTEDSGTTSEDDGLPCSPPEMSFHERVVHGAVYKYPGSQKHLSSLSLAGTGSEEEEQGDPFQPSSRPLSPVSKYLSPQPIISPASALTTPTAGADFSSPAGFMPRLDNSAARHRMSVKPRNQRASTRGKRVPPVSLSPRHRSESISDLDNVLSEEEEEDDETVMSTETVNHYLYSSLNLELTQKPTTPEPTETTPEKSAQDQEENPNRTLGVEIPRSEEFLETEGEVTSNPLYLQPLSFSLILSGPPSPSGLPESTAPSREIEFLRAHSPIQTHDRNDIQIQTSDTDKKETLRPHALPLPRLKKHKMETRSPPSPKGAEEASTKPWEAEVETAPNAGSVQFLIASAKYRSKATSETKQNEGHLKDSPGIKTQAVKPNPESQKDEVRETKPTELQYLLHQTQERKSSFCREVPPAVMSKPTTGTNLRKSDAAAEHVETEKPEEPEDRKIAFGVQLRTTSMSLKYRTDVSKIKDETKRYSLESNTVTEVSEEHAGKAETFGNYLHDSNSKSKPSVPKKLDSQNLDFQLAAQDYGRPSIQNTTGASQEAVSEPGWMSLAREKTRAYQPFLGRLSTNQSPVHPSSPTAPPAQPPKPVFQPKTPLLSTSLHPLKAASLQTSPRLPAKPAPGRTKDRQDKGRNSTPEDDSAKRAARPITPNNNTEALTLTPEPPATSSSSSSSSSPSATDISHQQQPRSDGAQPSWLELAKRKSLAWSDKTLELS
ncbi:CRACD-like protein isoform X2 [Carassius gibelio]|uniref:CRACD-like protein isoform X2 n=1 Tax=Carassius gibelio TaxID=101364 RepID=UPI0022788A29|nr:CRACD-like protein isoform X2 [Carassius gibelio]